MRDTPARALDARVWQDFGSLLMPPALILHALARARREAGLPQALQARPKPLREALAQRARQHARLLEVPLAERIARAACERQRQEVPQPQHRRTTPLRQLEAQAQP